MVFVKVCGITNPDDALFALAMGADAIGMILAPSTRRVDPDTVRDVVRALPADAVVVGVFRDERPETILEVVEHARLRGVQLHGHEIPRDASMLRRRVPFLVQAFSAGDPRLARVDEYPVDAVLLDSSTPGSGVPFDWSLADGVAPGKRVILAGGLDADNVAAAVEQVRPWGVDASSGLESRAGRKDARKVRRFVAAASDALAEFSSSEPSA